MRADDYKRAADDLAGFLDAVNRLVATLEVDTSGFGGTRFPTMQARRGQQEEANRLISEVSMKAGVAAKAFDLAGIGMDYKPPGTMNTKRVNPALIWSTIFDNMPMLDADLIFVCGQQALGILDHAYREQARRQRGFIGALAWFFTLAPRVRGAAGLPPRSVGGAAVTGITVIGQGLFVTVIGAALVKALGWA